MAHMVHKIGGISGALALGISCALLTPFASGSESSATEKQASAATEKPQQATLHVDPAIPYRSAQSMADALGPMATLMMASRQPRSETIDFTSADSLTVLVNKKNPLTPLSYTPKDLVAPTSLGVPSFGGQLLRKDAAEALAQMYAAAKKAGVFFELRSGYRSASTQATLHPGYANRYGSEHAELLSARAGYSEHQTGLAVDLTDGSELTAAFAKTEAAQWLAANSWKYGFILRYTQGNTGVTGYNFEPWHFRFLGVEESTRYYRSGAKTYEDYLGQPAAPTY
ncbi:D-alanyl-D-alanine carboxypeptidase [Arcanobacterium wilhelmae]|uniref:D-alanyl-D-alanine carboxypeptidase n=1 Tax=Arcanobacterium wilhelmae TaxID=1803177 RepID=A0ABT9NDG4_9ACTO|nr:M15 family metallopeptidase [Arcanobacterium wilhelmae]MDP9801555.1 D-alanyl-D-alanine carboxypeptidase [Arcanobacterium wilhelmae]WFN90882.1 M15 family metallopeptidase [Arcanobacterium wilhelmae]